MQNLGIGSLPFYVGSSPSGHTIWANSITYHELFTSYAPTAEVPTVAMVKLDEPSLYKTGELTPEAAADNNCPNDDIKSAGPRPAGLIVLPSGAAVVTLYSSVGAIAKALNPVSDRGVKHGCERFQGHLMEVRVPVTASTPKFGRISQVWEALTVSIMEMPRAETPRLRAGRRRARWRSPRDAWCGLRCCSRGGSPLARPPRPL